MPLTRFFWHRQPAIDAALVKHFADFIGRGKLVVDVGAGYDPWPHATEFVDYDTWPELAGRANRKVDIENEPLPYADKSVDFLYCRHTLEDLDHPSLLLREMNRVAKAGYIETPSPIAELCRGAEGGKSVCRGYHHHRWFVFVLNGALTFLPKFSSVEQFTVRPEDDDRTVTVLNENPPYWNTYHPWTGELRFRVLKQKRDFSIPEYYKLISDAYGSTHPNVSAFFRDLNLNGCEFAAAQDRNDCRW